MAIATAATLAASAALGIPQYIEQQKANKEAKKERKAQHFSQISEGRRRRLEARALARQNIAATMAAGEAAGASGSTPVAGAMASQATGVSANLAFLDTQQNLSNAAFSAGTSAASHQSSAQTWEAIGNLTTKAYSIWGKTQ